jgi:hypothetical protein
MEDRSQYLWLAQLSQGVIRNILLYLEDGKWDALRETTSSIVAPLDSLSSGAEIPRSDKAAFASYEHLTTLSEAWDPQELKSVVARLKTLIKAGDGPDAKHQAEELIEPFQKLSAQALWNFEQPEVGLPRGVFELCKAH